MAAALVIVFPIYQGVTQLDFTGPHQFLSRLPDAEVIVASMAGETVTADGLHFAALRSLEDIERCDVLCVPGGGGCLDAMQDEGYLEQIRRLAAGARYLTSVCTGSLILAAAGLLKGKRATCHWSMRDSLALFGAIPCNERVVRDGNIITGGGVTAGIDFALTLIAELHGEATAQAIQLGMEYAPAPPFTGGTLELTSAAVVQQVQATMAENLRRRQALVAQIAAHHQS
ncbi:DJ-1/PfpI family protein [Serratia sp. (in: enterobacteria)]|uniref:DJ-1/PfpI family protein n=1 Tax=Serratia sp. (in: enterobacteria) TaxID=616 RepID=UPI003988E979